MVTFDELIKKENPDIQQAIEDMADMAGTYDADWNILLEAGKLIANYRKIISELKILK